ncbi:MAG: HRDC domain-containing protein [bacterium]
MNAPRVTRVETPAELERAVARWSGAPELALDTEFVFERTYWPRPGLVQLAVGDEIALVDAVALPDLSALAGLLLADETQKLVHAGGGDALLLERTAGVRPRPVFDVQVGAAFCGLGISLPLDALVLALRGVTLGKHQTRTDWTRRPLSDEQVRYAAEDVVHLAPIAAELRVRLAALGRLAWAEEDSQAAVAAEPGADDPAQAWLRLRGIERFPAAALARARALAFWRDTEARRRDLPKTFLLRDETLLELARRPVADPEQLARARGFDPRRHAPFATAILAVLATADAAAPHLDPLRNRASSPPRQLDEKVAAAVEIVARDLALPTELLLSRRGRVRLLSGLPAGEPPSSRLAGWRREILGAAIDRAAA